MARDGQTIQLARGAAEKLLDDDPDLTSPQNANFASALALMTDRSTDWSRIS
jgi:hypothetical protein